MSDYEYGYNSKMALEKDSLWVVIFWKGAMGKRYSFTHNESIGKISRDESESQSEYPHNLSAQKPIPA